MVAMDPSKGRGGRPRPPHRNGQGDQEELEKGFSTNYKIGEVTHTLHKNED